MAKVCHAHCPDESGLGLVVLAVAVVAAGLAVVAWVIANVVVLVVGAAGVAVATVALYRLALRHTVLSGPVRRAVARPVQSPVALPVRPRAVASARQPRAIEAPRTIPATITANSEEIQWSPSSLS